MKNLNQIKIEKLQIRVIESAYMMKLRAKEMKPKIISEKGEFGISSVIGIAIGLIVAAFILIPGIQTFASKIISDMQLWWTNSISTQIFPN